MEEEKPNQVEQFKIPKRSIARFFKPSATRDEIEGRIIRARKRSENGRFLKAEEATWITLDDPVEQGSVPRST